MDFGLRSHVAIVAASSQGLGRAIAGELAAEGARVVLCARGKDALERACREIREAGGQSHGVVADVTVPADVRKVIEAADQQFGGADILVTNTGGPKVGRFETLTSEDWDAATRLLLSSAVGMVRGVLPGMRARKWGRIINVTSIAAKQPVEGLMLSNSLRAGVTAFARTLANEVAGEGITVNNVLPGYTRTERVVELAAQQAAARNTSPDAIVKAWEAEIPTRRLGEPRELAALAAFLASERAGYITGQSIAVDGGWIRGLF